MTTESKPEQAPAKQRKGWFGKFLIVLLFLVLLGGLGYMGKLYWDAQTRLKVLQNDAASKVNNLTDAEISTLVAQVGKHIALPSDRPQVVTITNVDELKKSQPFFNTAQNGDKLLVFMDKVVLYRISLDKVIDIAQIRPGTESATLNSSANIAPDTATPSSSQ